MSDPEIEALNDYDELYYGMESEDESPSEQQDFCSPFRVLHGYGNTRGVSKTGNAGMGTVLDFGIPHTPCTRTAVSRVFTG